MDDATIHPAKLRLAEIESKIAAAAKIAGCSRGEIELIAVSKTRSVDDIEPLILSGQLCFGENRVQEAAAKWPELKAKYTGLTLHLIGQLQSNKAADAVALFDSIHSVDRPSLIVALGKAMREQQRFIPCFIQINIGAEPQKGGASIAELPTLLALALEHDIPVAGLMCLPPADIEHAPFFALLAELAARHDLPGLSMGMSDDFDVAIMLGATHIRVGTALFGERHAAI
jgi:PLP dependent protein